MTDKIVFILFIVALVVQLYYYFNHFSLLHKFKPTILESKHPKITVLICAHNEEENLKNNLQTVIDQKYNAFEIIVVDDRSIDKTSEVVKSFANANIKLIKVDDISDDFSPKKNALTRGFEAANGEFVLLTDADCKPNSHFWISEMTNQIKSKTDIVLGYSPYQQKEGLLNKLIQFDTYFTAIQYLSFALSGKATMGVGRNLMVRSEAFFSVGGFDGFEKILAGDDDIIVQKIASKDNVEICITKNAFVKSKPETSFKNWFNQKRRHLSVGVNYDFSSLFKAALFQQSFIWLYLMFFIKIVFFISILELTLLYVFIILTRSFVVNTLLLKKLNVKIPLYILPLLEILYFFSYLLIGSSVLIKNKRKWR